MRKPNQDPIHSALPDLLARYPATSSVGITLRRGDARRRLDEIAEAEETVERQERLNAQIAARIQRMNAEHALQMEYLLRFGVTSAERQQFRHILEEVAQHGGLNLQEAANLAHTRYISGEGIEAESSKG